MRYVDEFRGETEAKTLRDLIARDVRKPVTLMEVCGGQTHTIIKYGLDELLPKEVRLLHGPGCPVCVTPIGLIDQAVTLSEQGVILTSFGDMLRVPGTRGDLFSAKARGGDVRIVYSPVDALKLAQDNPHRQVAFFAVGFETTAPAIAMVVERAHVLKVPNFSILAAHVLVPPALRAVLDAPGNEVRGFLAPGHVCAVMGYWEYQPIAAKYRAPIVVTGFEPLDLLQGIHWCVRALNEGRFTVDNQYSRAVTERGNEAAQAMMNRVFEVCDREWRGIGVIPQSGLAVRPAYSAYDAAVRFALGEPGHDTASECIAGDILRGRSKPTACPAFGTRCTPEKPLGAPMVSAEGVCAAYYQFGRHS